MKPGLTGSLVVCVAAAGVAVGALALEPGGSPAPAAVTPPPAQVPGGYDAGDGAGNVAPGASPASPASLVISDFAFAATTVSPGRTVTVVNRDGATHTVTADDGTFDSGEVGGGDTSSFTAPAEPGSHELICEIHPQMSGTLTVR
jgi:plastocyanin